MFKVDKVLSRMLIDTPNSSEEFETAAQEMYEMFSSLSITKNISELRGDIESSINDFFEKDEAAMLPKNIRSVILDNFNEIVNR